MYLFWSTFKHLAAAWCTKSIHCVVAYSFNPSSVGWATQANVSIVQWYWPYTVSLPLITLVTSLPFLVASAVWKTAVRVESFLATFISMTGFFTLVYLTSTKVAPCVASCWDFATITPMGWLKYFTFPSQNNSSLARLYAFGAGMKVFTPGMSLAEKNATTPGSLCK